MSSNVKKLTFYKYRPQDINKLNPHQFWAAYMEGFYINISIKKDTEYGSSNECYRYNVHIDKNEKGEKKICSGKARELKRAQEAIASELASYINTSNYISYSVDINFNRRISYTGYPSVQKLKR